MGGRRVPEGNQPTFRLFDRVRAAWGYPELPVIVADAIAEQIDMLPDKEDYSPPASEYGIVAPPFKKCFIEATTHAYAQCWLNPRTILPESYTQRGGSLVRQEETMIVTITITPPLQCCVLIAARQRCGQPATVGQATVQADGSYYLQVLCAGCVAAMAKNYGIEAQERDDSRRQL